MSSGLTYAPGAYARTPELVSLSEVVAEHRGIYATHMRNEGSRLVEAVAEAIEIGVGDESDLASLTGPGTRRVELGSRTLLPGFVEAEKASWALRTLIQRADRLELTHQGTDTYGRALVVLQVNGVDVAREMIRAGHGRPFGGGLRGTWCS